MIAGKLEQRNCLKIAMVVLPIVTRELLVQARRKGTYWIRVVASAVAGFLMLWLLVAGSAPIPTASQGQTLFTILSVLAFIYCLFVGALVTADCLSAEKRDGTIGLIFLTDLKGYDVVLGKLVSSSIHAVYGLLAAVPMMSLTLLFGGVTAIEIGRVTLVLGNTLFLSLAAGMFVSTLSRNDRTAVCAAVLLVLLTATGPYLLGYYLANNFALGTAFHVKETVLPPSPIFAFMLIQDPPRGLFPPGAFYASLAQTHAIAWVLLSLSCLIVPLACQERPAGPRRIRLSKEWRRWRIGSDPQHASFRRRSLDCNPLLWLSSRERFKAASPWVLVLPLAAIALWIYVKYWQAFYETALLVVFTIHVLLKVWLAGETCNRWVEDRRCGALELLLCAPLQVKQMLQGQGLALRRQFGWPVAVTLVLTLLAWAVVILLFRRGPGTEFGRTWLLISIPVLIVDLSALRWVGTWQALTARGLNRAIGATIARVLGLRWVIYLFLVGLANAWQWLGYGQLAFVSKPQVWLGLAVTFDLYLGWSARRKCLAHFRDVAANTFDFRNPAEVIADGGTTRVVLAKEPGMQVKDRTRVFSWLSERRARHAAVVLTVLTLVIGALPAYRHYLNWKVNRRIAMIQRAGLPISLEDLERRRPPITNGVDVAELLGRIAPGLKIGSASLQQTNLPQLGVALPGPSEALPRWMRRGMMSVLESNRTAFAMVQKAPALSMGRYDSMAMSQGFNNQWQAFWMITRMLEFDVLLRSEDRDVQGALDSLKRLLELSRSAGREHSMAFQNTRSGSFARAVVAMRWMLVRCRLSDSELKALQDELSAAEAQIDYSGALAAFQCGALASYRSLQTFSSVPAPVMGGPPGGTGVILREQIRARLRDLSGGRERDLITFLDGIDDFMLAAKAPPAERYRQANRSFTSDMSARVNFLAAGGVLVRGPPPFGFTKYSAFEFLISRIAEFEARCRAASIGLAIERFRLSHAGHLPDELEDLVPSFIAEVPCDPFDGQPIRYKKMPNGYRVYSVGRNGQDDGGAEQETRLPTASVFPPPDDITFSVER
jgi:ABC-type transport system involved in multi-copper enzyme maturation permease subunit